MAFNNSGTKASLRPPTKRCELPLIFATIGQAIRRWKDLNLGSLNMQFQHDWGKDQKITALLIFLLKTKKVRSTKLYGAPLEGSTIFLNRSSTCHMSMESYRLAELKYAIFSRTGCKTKKLRRSELYGRS